MGGSVVGGSVVGALFNLESWYQEACPESLAVVGIVSMIWKGASHLDLGLVRLRVFKKTCFPGRRSMVELLFWLVEPSWGFGRAWSACSRRRWWMRESVGTYSPS